LSAASRQASEEVRVTHIIEAAGCRKQNYELKALQCTLDLIETSNLYHDILKTATEKQKPKPDEFTGLLLYINVHSS